MVLGEHSLGTHGDILVVDDEPAIVEVVALYLRRDGFDVRIAHDGLTAQETIAEKLPALVVLDVMLPGLDGLALMRQLRADPVLCERALHPVDPGFALLHREIVSGSDQLGTGREGIGDPR